MDAGKKDSSGGFARSSSVPQRQPAVRTLLDDNQSEMLVFLWLAETVTTPNTGQPWICKAELPESVLRGIRV